MFSYVSVISHPRIRSFITRGDEEFENQRVISFRRILFPDAPPRRSPPVLRQECMSSGSLLGFSSACSVGFPCSFWSSPALPFSLSFSPALSFALSSRFGSALSLFLVAVFGAPLSGELLGGAAYGAHQVLRVICAGQTGTRVVRLATGKPRSRCECIVRESVCKHCLRHGSSLRSFRIGRNKVAGKMFEAYKSTKQTCFEHG